MHVTREFNLDGNYRSEALLVYYNKKVSLSFSGDNKLKDYQGCTNFS